jgi:hypothetical protein
MRHFYVVFSGYIVMQSTTNNNKKQWAKPSVVKINKQVIEALPQFGFLSGGWLNPLFGAVS